MRLLLAAPLLAGLLLTGCSAGAEDRDPVVTGSADGQAEESSRGQQYPDVLSAELSGSGEDFTVSVTMSSPYDTPDRYADGWRVLAPDGTVLGEHMLAHDHASEQPFTRQQSGLEIPQDVQTVTVQGRDQANGFGGDTVDVQVTR